MIPSAIFIARPVATTLLTIAVTLAGAIAYFLLPVAPLPQVDYPTISVTAAMSGASPEVMATSVVTPLERHLGQIADVDEMTSNSGVGSSRIILQFGLNRDINGASRDVQAAINASFADLPSSLKSYPVYRKQNPADRPVLIFALKSRTLTLGQLYDSAATIMAPQISQIDGVSNVSVGGSSLPAVRVELLPMALYKYGIGLEDVRAALASANANAPKGAIEIGSRHFQLYTNDQISHAEQYNNMIIAYRDGRPVFLNDVSEIYDGVEDIRNMGISNGEPAVLMFVFRQPNANIITVADNIKRLMPFLQASIPSSINLSLVMDRTATIRASLHDVQKTLLLSLVLVTLVVFFFLGNIRATIVPSIAVPVSIIGTFGAMYLLGYSLNNLSLMALTVCTGFVVDDSIVVIENVMRHMEAGMSRSKAALLGSKEVGFTVLSMSLSLVAVFLPILMMGGMIGRLFREFAVTLAVAVIISLVVSLTTTPMMCSTILPEKINKRPRITLWSDRLFLFLRDGYKTTLSLALHHHVLTMSVMIATIFLNIYLYTIVPKGLIPQQDTGILVGAVQADQSISFQLMRQKLAQLINIIHQDTSVENVTGFTGGGGFGGGAVNSGIIFVSLKPIAERMLSADMIIGRLRKKLSNVAGATLFLQASQDVSAGGRLSNAQYQYTLEGDSLESLRSWTPKLVNALKTSAILTDVNSDQQDSGLESRLVIDRATASRLGLSPAVIDNTIYDAFGQRQVSTIYGYLNQYHIIMEAAPRFWQSPEALTGLFVSSNGGTISGSQSTNFVAGTYSSAKTAMSPISVASDAARNAASNSLASSGKHSTLTGSAVSTTKEKMVPLSAIAHFEEKMAPLAVNHHGHFPSTTISFNLVPGKSLSDAVKAIDEAKQKIDLPTSIQGDFAGMAKMFKSSVSNQPLLILAAFVAVYIVLGILYESYIHPITILSTLPSAGIGALIALMAFNTEFSMMALIGVILLIGIVKKNAIMMIDVALELERTQSLSSEEAIYQACMLRFRPIMMTTMVALLGALPLAIGHGNGAELRRPLGISIMGGLLFSQILTLYTTPVVYLYLDRLRLWSAKFAARLFNRPILRS